MTQDFARAAVLTAFHEPLELQSFPIPRDIEPGAALVRVQMAGVCGTDVHLWKGQLPIPLPTILGHETVGVIEALGPGLETDWDGAPLRSGDRITWNSSRSCGSCYYCQVRRLPTRCPNRRAYGVSYSSEPAPHLVGGFAECIYLRPGTAIFRLPDGLATEQVAGSGCALVTAIHGIERAGVDWGDTVVIQGAGPVGISALAVALSAGASRACVVGGPAHRLAVARRFGAEETIDIAETTPETRLKRVLEWSGGYGADLVVECVGAPVAVPEGMLFCRDGGRYLVLGHYANAGEVPVNPHVITRKQLQVLGSWSSEPRHMSAGLKFLQRTADRFPFHSLVTDRFPLERAGEALQAMANWSACKSVVVPEGAA